MMSLKRSVPSDRILALTAWVTCLQYNIPGVWLQHSWTTYSTAFLRFLIRNERLSDTHKLTATHDLAPNVQRPCPLHPHSPIRPTIHSTRQQGAIPRLVRTPPPSRFPSTSTSNLSPRSQLTTLPAYPRTPLPPAVSLCSTRPHPPLPLNQL